MTIRQDHCQPFHPVDFSQVVIDDGFWTPRIETNRTKSLVSQFQHLCESGALANFNRVAGVMGGAFQGLFFIDSDVYKWLEASCYSLKTHPDPDLEASVDEAIGRISAAQEPDGYVNTYFQLVEPKKKFTNFGVCHELYTGSHLIQAGIAHFYATGQRTLLTVACRFADHLTDVFGPGKLEGFDGHAGIEMALIALYRLAGKPEYLVLAEYFINQRGRPESRLRWELAHLDEIAGKPGKPGQNNRKFFGSFEAYDGRHAQDHLPVREQSEAVGHAVRAAYLYCGMADLAVETGERELIATLERLWRHLTSRRMYVTGGIGPSRTNEGFTRDYDLPNDMACAESCAAVGMVMWNQRMLNLTGEGRYADLMERVLYNALLVGVSLDGEKYFYNNPLQSHGETHRERWYECACCPPNIARMLASLGGYVYSRTDRGLVIHLFVQSRISFEAEDETILLRQTTNYPWTGDVSFSLEMNRPSRFELRLRIPGWCRKHQVRINDIEVEALLHDGYVVLDHLWHPGNSIQLTLDMPVDPVVSHPAVRPNTGKVALQRGPLIYCIETADNPYPVDIMILPENSGLASRFIPDLLGGVVAIEGEGLLPDMSGWKGRLYRPKEESGGYQSVRFRAIPYYCWDNREPGAMTVWINR